MRDWHPVSTAPFGRNLQLSVHENEGVHSLVFPAGGQKADGCMPQQRNEFSSILHTGVSGRTEIRAKITSQRLLVLVLLRQQLRQLSLLFGEQLGNGLPL